MKIEWTVEDIEPGLIVGKPNRKEQWMIGWIQSKVPGEDHTWLLISHNADGMVSCVGTKAHIVERLNLTRDLPVKLYLK